MKIARSKTKQERNLICQKSGVSHYSVLLELEYFDIIRFCTVDPMHWLFSWYVKENVPAVEWPEIIFKESAYRNWREDKIRGSALRYRTTAYENIKQFRFIHGRAMETLDTNLFNLLP